MHKGRPTTHFSARGSKKGHMILVGVILESKKGKGPCLLDCNSRTLINKRITYLKQGRRK